MPSQSKANHNSHYFPEFPHVIYIFFLRFQFLFERKRERLRNSMIWGRGRGTSSLPAEQRALWGAGLHPRTLGPWPRPKADAQPTEPPRCPHTSRVSWSTCPRGCLVESLSTSPEYSAMRLVPKVYRKECKQNLLQISSIIDISRDTRWQWSRF